MAEISIWILIMKKVCKKCGVEKPISNFSKSGNQVLADGSVVQRYKSTCRQCVNTGPMKRKDNIDPKQCIKCGISKPLSDFCFYKNKNGDMRYTGECKECKRVRSKKWFEKNPDRMRVYYDTRNEKIRTNPEIRRKLTEFYRQWREKGDNRDRLNEGARKRYWNNPDETGIIYQGQKEIKGARSTARYERNKQKCVDKLGGKCVKCGTTEHLQFDHINPLEKSFTISSNFHRKDLDEELAKCQLLCWDCHMEKTKNDWLSGNLYVGIGEDRSDITT